jgi:hypothetical protein
MADHTGERGQEKGRERGQVPFLQPRLTLPITDYNIASAFLKRYLTVRRDKPACSREWKSLTGKE